MTRIKLRLRRFWLLNQIAWDLLTAPVDSPRYRRVDSLVIRYRQLTQQLGGSA